MEAFVLVAGIVLFVIIMGSLAIRLENGTRRRECRPTFFQMLSSDVRKDSPQLPETLDDIKKPYAVQFALEIITFVVRFICRDAALPRLRHPRFASMRKDIIATVQPVLDDIGIDNPAEATVSQQTQAASLILNDEEILTELMAYCLGHFPAFRHLYNVNIDPSFSKRRDIQNYRQLIPSLDAMTWLRLMHEEQATAS